MTSNQNSLFKKVVKESQKSKEERVFSVSSFLDLINKGLRKSEAGIKGEISSFKKSGGYLFFSIKDQEDESILNCFMWKSDYDLSGVDLEVGMEIIARGYPKIHKPNGRLSLQTKTVELVGEGVLKKAYDKLKAKLKEEGLFEKERKRPLPEFPKKIGVITSLKGGTVIHDFENNLGNFGFKIKAIDSRVEGKKAVKSLVSSIKTMKNQDIDVLVIIRGGGSIESLQAFDNETIVREIVDFPTPVLAGIGHHEDVTLTAMASDAMASTPNGAAEMLNKSWEEARHKVNIFEKDILSLYQKSINNTKEKINSSSQKIQIRFKKILESFRRLEHKFRNIVSNLGHSIKNKYNVLDNKLSSSFSYLESIIKNCKHKIKSASKSLDAYNPERQLDLGYSIISLDEKIIRSINDVKRGDNIDIKVSDGTIEGEVKNKK